MDANRVCKECGMEFFKNTPLCKLDCYNYTGCKMDLDRAEKKIKELELKLINVVEALSFYADKENYLPKPLELTGVWIAGTNIATILCENGLLAKAVLEDLKK